ncbi:unnamed protein product [Schistosoma curassoni]|uniref:Uncharacterized protein n=1 Tax=Schistosoma curassoni TaxID=6186 RepID=A0A183JF98_9TREM|nr:unnamed protein product [Schistosoma curassoni]
MGLFQIPLFFFSMKYFRKMKNFGQYLQIMND